MQTVKIQQEQLLLGLTTVLRAISTKNVLPILSNILLTFTDKKLTLFATDLEIGIETSVDAEESTPFKTTVPARLFTDLISTMPGQLIVLEYDEANENILVNGLKSRHNIKCISAENYPAIPEKVNSKLFEIDSILFKTTISRILFAASDEESKPAVRRLVPARSKHGQNMDDV